MKTEVKLGTGRFERFSSWKILIVAISLLAHFVKRFKNKVSNSNLTHKTENAKINAQELVVREVQHEVYEKEMEC